MNRTTSPLEPSLPLLKLDDATGELREREYEISVTSGPDAGRTLRLNTSVVVGTDPAADLPLTDATVSRSHLRLIPRADGLHVEDLRSSNGTFVLGSRIRELTVEGESQLRVGKTLLHIRPVERPAPLQEELDSFGGVQTQSPAMRRFLGLLARAAGSGSHVLLTGESGVGKEVFARLLHANSPRANQPLVTLDCAALVPDLAESDLFGHVQGAFTGALASRAGAFQSASGGTLLLDEVGELPLALQPKLLRVLDTRTVRPVGQDTVHQVDVRVLAATHRDLRVEVAAGRFREDLFYRLAVLTLRVPPLRERLEDIPGLIRRFVQAMGKDALDLTGPLMERFREYAWPGNVRELRNVLDAAVAGVQVQLQHTPARGGGFPAPQINPERPYKEAKEDLVQDFTRAYFSALMTACGGNLSEMSRRAGIARHHLRALLERHGLRADPGD